MDTRHESLAGLQYQGGFLSNEDSATLADELLFQRAVQTYLWALPALNMYVAIGPATLACLGRIRARAAST